MSAPTKTPAAKAGLSKNLLGLAFMRRRGKPEGDKTKKVAAKKEEKGTGGTETKEPAKGAPFVVIQDDGVGGREEGDGAAIGRASFGGVNRTVRHFAFAVAWRCADLLNAAISRTAQGAWGARRRKRRAGITNACF